MQPPLSLPHLFSSDSKGGGDCQLLPGPSSGSAPFHENYQQSLGQHDLDEEDFAFLSGHIAEGTAVGYNSAFNEFKTYCLNISVDPFNCTPSVVVKYLCHKFENGASYSAINLHRSSISKFHPGCNGQPIGIHPLVRQAVKAVFR